MSAETKRTELVERLAREAGIPDAASGPYAVGAGSMSAELECFAALVAGECARLALAEEVETPTDEDRAYNMALAHAAAAIRERFGITEE